MRSTIVAFAVCVGMFLSFSLVNQIHAQIKIEVDREFTLSKQGVMAVKEDESLTNTFSDRFIPGGTERKYFFVISAQEKDERQQVADAIYQSTKVTVNGGRIDFKRIEEEGVYGISYILTKRLNPNEKQTISIQYVHPELGEKVGGLVDAYIPAFAEDFKFDLGNTVYTYRTKLKIPKDAGDENIVSVAPSSKFTEGDFDIYVFTQDSLVGKFVWVQRGSQQVYKFKITQKLLPTDNVNRGNLNEYRMIIPRDMEEQRIEQKVYLTNISPTPIAVSKDEDDNVIGIFRVPSHEEVDIVIEGYALLKNRTSDKITSAGTLDMIDQSKFAKYLQPAEYWEVNDDKIDEAREERVGDETEVYEVIKDIYSSIVDSIDYSQVKRFGINERQGALRTLEGGAAVCMEYSDLYLTLARNAGVPSRAAFGYGYDSRLPANEQEAHQWVQSYLPEQDHWVSVDVTWGETGPQVIGGDLNHFFTHVATKSPNDPSILSRLSLGQVDAELLGPEFEVEVLAKLPDGLDDESMTIDELFETYPETEIKDQDYYIASIKYKFENSFKLLLGSPGNLDIQGWFAVGITSGALIILLYFWFRVVRIFWKMRK